MANPTKILRRSLGTRSVDPVWPREGGTLVQCDVLSASRLQLAWARHGQSALTTSVAAWEHAVYAARPGFYLWRQKTHSLSNTDKDTDGYQAPAARA